MCVFLSLRSRRILFVPDTHTRVRRMNTIATQTHSHEKERARVSERRRSARAFDVTRASPVPSSRFEACRFRQKKNAAARANAISAEPFSRTSRPRSRRVVTLVARPEVRDAAVEKAQRGLRAVWPLVRRHDDPRPRRPPPDPVHVLGAAQRSAVPHVGVPERRGSQGAPDGRRRADVQRERQVRQHGGGPPLRAQARAAAPHKRQGLADPRGPSARHDGHRENRGGERTTRRFFALPRVSAFRFFFFASLSRRRETRPPRTARPNRSTDRAHRNPPTRFLRKSAVSSRRAVSSPPSKNAGPHWPRLLRSAEKNPHVKTDFDKWVDEDEEDEADRADAFDMSSLESMSKYREDDFVDPADSDDDEDMPPLERAK